MESKRLWLILQPFSTGRRSHGEFCAPCSLSFRWMSSSWPKLESATGRARKRRRHIAKVQALPSTTDSKRTIFEPEIARQYPKGQPWRVLWPHPHEDPSFVKKTRSVRTIPRWSDITNGWAAYKETWEDGIRGVPSPEKMRQREAQEAAQLSASTFPRDSSSDYDKIQSNLTKNIESVKGSAQDLVDLAKEKTDIHSRDDLQKVASDMMKLATACLKEFMVGYREGRDQEIDRVLHEYFQEGTPEAEEANKTTKFPTADKAKRRRPRRALLR